MGYYKWHLYSQNKFCLTYLKRIYSSYCSNWKTRWQSENIKFDSLYKLMWFIFNPINIYVNVFFYIWMGVIKDGQVDEFF